MFTHVLLIAALLTPSLASAANYWTAEQGRVKRSTHSTSGYDAALHQGFQNKQDYEEGGRFYYSEFVNSFGQKEVLNTDQEIIFCGPNDKTFSETISTLFKGPGQGFQVEGEYAVRDDSTSIGFTPEAFNQSVYNTLVNNSNSTAKGRFCYRENNSKVDYRNPGAEKAVYCDPRTSSAHGAEKVFLDTSSGNSCAIALDIPLKLGETRFVRQLQETGSITIGQGFLGCYPNATSSLPEVVLIDNPESCTKTNRANCTKTCEWAYEVVCDAALMPKWGGGKCGAVGTMLFKDDIIEVNSADSLSYDVSSNQLYRGEAVMSCAMISERAQWVVSNQSCSPVTQTNPGAKGRQ